MREMHEIQMAAEELADRVWLERHQVLIADEHTRGDLQAAEQAAQSIRRELGAGKTGPYTDLQWGELNGKLSALR